MNTSVRTARASWGAVLIGFVLGAAALHTRAQDEDPQPEEQLPSLDELLGLEDAETPRDGEAIDPARADLDRTLESPGSLGDAFEQAVRLMDDSADRLRTAKDTGIVTQRIQEDILTRLQTLIDQAQQQQSSSSSSSSSSQQQQQQQQNQPNQQNQQSQTPQRADGEPSEGADAPAGQDARPGQATLNAAAWGALPERLRDSLLQGSAEGYSSLYRSLTEAYYRRLAEEASE